MTITFKIYEQYATAQLSYLNIKISNDYFNQFCVETLKHFVDTCKMIIMLKKKDESNYHYQMLCKVYEHMNYLITNNYGSLVEHFQSICTDDVQNTLIKYDLYGIYVLLNKKDSIMHDRFYSYGNAFDIHNILLKSNYSNIKNFEFNLIKLTEYAYKNKQTIYIKFEL